MKKRIDLTLWHDGCWMLKLTRDRPDVELVVTDICSDGTDILATIVISGDDLDFDEVLATTAAFPTVRSTDLLEAGQGYLRIHIRYDAEASIYAAVVASSLTPVGEIRIADDREQWTLLADGSAISRSIADLENVADVDVRRVVDYEPDTPATHDLVDEIRSELSPRQLTYLLSALEEGYYGWPRDISAKQLAENHDVSGPTALEHLRKGEAVALSRLLRTIRERERRGVDRATR